MYLNLAYLMQYFVISNIYSQPMVTFQVSNKVDNIHVHKLPLRGIHLLQVPVCILFKN